MAGRSDAEDLREDLIHDINVLCGDLKHLGYDLKHIPEFLNEARALALDAQIPKLQRQLERMQKTKTQKQADHVAKNIQSVAHVDQKKGKSRAGPLPGGKDDTAGWDHCRAGRTIARREYGRAGRTAGSAALLRLPCPASAPEG